MELDKKQKRIIKRYIVSAEVLWHSLVAMGIAVISEFTVLIVVTIFYLINGDSGARTDLKFLMDVDLFASILQVLSSAPPALFFVVVWKISEVQVFTDKNLDKVVKSPSAKPGTYEAASLSMMTDGVVGTLASLKAADQGADFLTRVEVNSDRLKNKFGIKTNWLLVRIPKIISILCGITIVGISLILGVSDAMGLNDSYSAVVELNNECETSRKCETKGHSKTDDGGYSVEYKFGDINATLYVSKSGHVAKASFDQDIENIDGADNNEIKASFVDTIEEFMERIAPVFNKRVKNSNKLRNFTVDSSKIEEKEEDGKIKLTYSKDHLDW